MDQQNNQALTCSICSYQFNQANRVPRMIPDCGHTYCEDCIIKNLVNSKHTFKCPEDGDIILCNRDSINNFPKNISILKIVQHQDNQKQNSFGVFQQKPFQMAEVLSQKSIQSAQSFIDKNMISCSSQEIKPQMSSNKYSLKSQYQQQCQVHGKAQDLGCLQCQQKICAHCAIFGNHKNHTVIPEDEMKKKNKNGLEQMIKIKQKIQLTKEDFVNKMEDNFQNIICNKINFQKGLFKSNTRLKFEEFQKLLEYSEQKCYDEIEIFFEQVEEKFRKFKNHTFKETYDKIYNWNQMIDTVRVQQESLDRINSVDFDLFLNLEKLLISGNELEIEQHNLIQFPVKLIGDYLDNICFSFSDSVQTIVENCMSIQFLQNESDIIHKSIQNLTLENQKEILSNTQFFQLSPLEIKAILGTPNQTPAEKFLNSHQDLTNKQNMKASNYFITSRKNSNTQQSSHQNSLGQKFKQKCKESNLSQKEEVSLENVDSIVAQLGQYRQNNILPQLKESALSKDKLLLSNLDNQLEFIKSTALKESMFNSVVINSNESDRQHQIYPFVNDVENGSKTQCDNSFNNDYITVINYQNLSPQNKPFIQNISDIKMDGSGLLYYKNGPVSVHDSCKIQAAVEKSLKGDIKKSQLQIENPFSEKRDNSQIRNSQINNSSLNKSRNRSPFKFNDLETSSNGKMKKSSDLRQSNLEIKSARSHYTNADPYQDISSLKKSLTPTKKTQRYNGSEIIKAKEQMSNINNYSYINQQNNDLSKTLPTRMSNYEDTYNSSSATAIEQNSNHNLVKKNNNSIKNNTLKFIKSPNKSNVSNKSVTQQQQTQSPNTQRKTAYKKKSEKLKILLQKLKQNEYIDQIELVSEDVNDQECEELGIELGKTKLQIDSIKLVKNKISDLGLQYILLGLEKSNQKIHTLNLTNNICSENCFDDILNYLSKNENLKNIYLINNNIQTYKKKDKLKNIQLLCNIHI
ncbi:hypothetical protein ABPG72_007181 [Tetrahymena utriculariae]